MVSFSTTCFVAAVVVVLIYIIYAKLVRLQINTFMQHIGNIVRNKLGIFSMSLHTRRVSTQLNSHIIGTMSQKMRLLARR